MRTRLLSPTPAGIRQAAAILRGKGRGGLPGLVAFPTETVYGLGAMALDRRAVRRVFHAKRRPPEDPLILHIASAEDLPLVAKRVPPAAKRLARRFWPGPLTLVLSKAAAVPREVTGGLATVAVRCPDHPVAQALLRALGAPLVGPSANRFGRLSPTTPEAVRADLGGRIEAILDAGPTSLGIESTILDLTGARPRILRLGSLPRAALSRVLGRSIPVARRAAAPGRFGRHYAPLASLEILPRGRIDVRAKALAQRGLRAEILRLPADPRAAARGLYARLRALDVAATDRILVERPPHGGAWEGVLDRLRRAAMAE